MVGALSTLIVSRVVRNGVTKAIGGVDGDTSRQAIQLRMRDPAPQNEIVRKYRDEYKALSAILDKRPKILEFPMTRWRQRLGARWSGGGHIVVTLPTPTQGP